MSPLNTSSRSDAIDVAKGIGILLVVLGHNPMVLASWSELFEWVYSFHVPLFFLLAGVFLKPQERIGAVFWRRVDSVLKPYIAGAVLYALVNAWKGVDGASGGSAGLGNWLGILYGDGATLGSAAPLWFLPHLFLAACLSTMLLKCLLAAAPGRRRWMGAGLVAVFLMGAGFLPICRASALCAPLGADQPGLPWSIDLLPVTVPLVMAGYLGRRQILRGVFRPGYFLVILAGFVLLHFFTNDYVDLNRRIFTSVPISSIGILVGIALALEFANLFAIFPVSRAPLVYVGRASLVILLFHGLFQSRFLRLQEKLLPNSWGGGLIALLGAVLACLVMHLLVQRVGILRVLFLPTPRPASPARPAESAGLPPAAADAADGFRD